MSTRSTTRLLLWMLPLLLSTLACRAATSLIFPDTPTPLPPPTLTPSPLPTETATLIVTTTVTQQASCPATLSEIINAASIPGEDEEPDTERYLVTYSVQGDEISQPVYLAIPADLRDEQDDLATQQEIWNYFAALIPEKNREMVTEYSIFTDGKDNILAAVAQTYKDPSQWTLEVDIMDSTDYSNLTYTMVHEFGHLLTLNAEQVPPSDVVFNSPENSTLYDQEVSQCPNYFPGEGCSRPDSYINQFYQRFWSELYPEWAAIDQIEDEIQYYQKLNEFYEKYQDQFVNEYAVTNPVEDIAETWTYFVLAPRPQGNSIADQKVLSFYEHPELVELRADILNRLCTVFPE